MTLLSDNGGEFIAKFFRAVCRIFGIRNLFTTAYHPQTNGQAKRFNRTLKSALRKYVAEHQKDWDLYTSAIAYGYNTQVHPATGYSPFELTVSRPPQAIGVESAPPTEELPPREAKKRFLHQLRMLCGQATITLSKHQRQYKHGFDNRVRPRSMPAEGSFVYLRNDSGLRLDLENATDMGRQDETC